MPNNQVNVIELNGAEFNTAPLHLLRLMRDLEVLGDELWTAEEEGSLFGRIKILLRSDCVAWGLAIKRSKISALGRELFRAYSRSSHGSQLPCPQIFLDSVEFNWQEQTARNFIRFSRCHSNPQTLGICTCRSVASICSPQDLASAIQ